MSARLSPRTASAHRAPRRRWAWPALSSIGRLLPVARQPVELSLFWRTFFLLALLLAGGIVAWVQTLRPLEFEPRAVQAAQQTARLVNLSRTALRTVDAINRVALVRPEGRDTVRVVPREPGTTWESYATDRFSQNVTAELASRLGADAVVARSVNGKPGMWVGFSIDQDRYWVQSRHRAHRRR